MISQGDRYGYQGQIFEVVSVERWNDKLFKIVLDNGIGRKLSVTQNWIAEFCKANPPTGGQAGR